MHIFVRITVDRFFPKTRDFCKQYANKCTQAVHSATCYEIELVFCNKAGKFFRMTIEALNMFHIAKNIVQIFLFNLPHSEFMKIKKIIINTYQTNSVCNLT
jgi:hypothetical protein